VAVLVHRCLEKSPEQRFQSAADLAFALRTAGSATSGGPRPVRRAMAGRRGTPALLATVAVILVGTTVGVTRWLWVRQPELPKLQQLTYRDGAIGAARFSPEGRVVFSAAFDGQPEEVYSQAAGTSELQSLGLVNARLVSISSGSGKLGVISDPGTFYSHAQRGTLAQAPPTGGVLRELAEGVVTADWSGSGELAVVRRDGSRMWIERPVGTSAWSGPGWLSDLRFSPDGTRLAFLHHRGSDNLQAELIVLDRANAARVLTPSLGSSDSLRIEGFAWAPDGKEMRFTSIDATETTLCSVSPGQHVRPLQRLPGWFELEDIDRNGRALLKQEIWAINLAVFQPGEHSPRELAWYHNGYLAALSVDGRSVLFVDWAGTHIEALLRRIDGSLPTALGSGFPLALSPDGKTAALTDRLNRGLLLLPTGPGTVRRLELPGLEVWLADWSRDGRTLLVGARPEGRGDLSIFPVDVMQAQLRPPIPGASARPTEARMAVSPDGRSVALSAPDGVVTIHPVHGGQPIRLSELPLALDPLPAGWSDGGDLWIYLRHTRPPRLLRVDVAAHQVKETRELSLPDAGTFEALHARITPDGRVIAVDYQTWRSRLWMMIPEQPEPDDSNRPSSP
jgi:WD40 repeat protein